MYFLIFFLVIATDQLSKYVAKTNLLSFDAINIIPNFFNITYVENRGAAFGIFRDMKFLLIGVTSVIILLILAYVIKNRKLDKFLKFSLVLIASGAIGNLIDRIYLGYVVDFFHLYIGKIIDFPVFNVADISVVVGTFFVALYVIFSKEQNKVYEKK